VTQPVTRNYGTGALTRWDCPTCGPNSLHKHNVCIHCGRNRSSYTPPIGAAVRGFGNNLVKAKR